MIENLQRFIFTFGFGHVNEGQAIEIFAENYGSARECMVKMYGNKWAFQYTGEEWDESVMFG